MVAAHAREQAAQSVELILSQTERTADVAHRALAAIADDGGRQRGTIAAVFAEHILDDFLTAFMLEIDINVWWLIAFLRQEALEQ